ncbi:MAG: alkaline phosphatase family protein, partial [Candidatus Latescibacteria bacterium]|nr:alkaline phosphatase family protein [Candidatus Latescibacterota bacterium]
SCKLVILLVDALGYLAVEEQMARDPRLGLSALAEKGIFSPLTSVFPSTTAVALTTLHTGLDPVSHGITGYRMYLPDREIVANMIHLRSEGSEDVRLLQKRGDARRLLGVPTVHRLLARAGVPSICLIRNEIANSGLSELLYQGASEVIPFVSSSDLFVQIRKLVASDPGRPACIWAYWGHLDTIQHRYGTGGNEPPAEVRNLAYSLQEELLRPLERSRGVKASLMLLSDHGHVDCQLEDVLQIRRLRKLQTMLAVPPAGTGRSPYLHLKAAEASQAAAYLAGTLGDRALVVGRDEALSGGLWGPGKAWRDLPGRIGDVVLLMRGARTVFYPHRAKSRVSHVVGGRHGGLHEREMLVPLFCSKL